MNSQDTKNKTPFAELFEAIESEFSFRTKDYREQIKRLKEENSKLWDKIKGLEK